MTRAQSRPPILGTRGVLSSDSLPGDLSETERFNLFFHEARPAFAEACDVVQAEAPKTSANFEFAYFGDAACVRFRANVSRKTRSAQHVAADPRDAYHLVFNTNAAPLLLSQHGREAVQEPGDVRLINLAEPLDIRSPTDMAAVCLSLSGARLREHGVNPDDLVLSALDPANAALRHLRRYMLGLLDGGEFEGDPVLSARVQTTLIELAVLALGAGGDSTALAGNGGIALLGTGTLPGAKPQGVRYRFAGFELEPRERRLHANGAAVTLTPKVFDTLVLLVEQAGHVVSRDELMAALWPRGFVTDHNLAKHIWVIRKALSVGCGEDAQFIETVPKLGYRFVVPVEVVAADDVAAAKENSSSPDSRVSGSPTPSAPTLETQRHWVPDIAARFRDDEQTPGSANASEPPSAISSEPLRVAGGDPAGRPLAATAEAANDMPAAQRVLGRRASDRQLALALSGAVTAHKRRRRWAVALAAIVVLAMSGVAGGLLWRRAQARRGPLPRGTTVAIVVFRNLSNNPKDAWLGPALTDMLATEVTATGKMHVLPGGLVRPARKDLPVPVTGGFAPASLATLRKRLGADYVISGSYLVSGVGTDARVRVDVVVQDARNGAGIAQFSRTQPESGLLALVTGAGGMLRKQLGLPTVAPNQTRQLASAQPPSPDVARHIGFALDALHAYDPARARDELLQAVAEAPAYAPAYALLSKAWMEVGYTDKARAAIAQAAAFVGSLPEPQRLRIQAQKQVLDGNLTDAAGTWRKLVALRPDDPESYSRLVQVLSRAGKTTDARNELTRWHKLSGAANDPRWELAASDVAASLGELQAAADHAKRALQLAQDRDASGLIAKAQLVYGISLHDLNGPGNPAPAEQMLKRSIAGFRKLDDPNGEASGYIHLAAALAASDSQRSLEYLQRGLALYQEIGEVRGQAQAYADMSRILWRAGDAGGAEAAITKAVGMFHRTGDLHDEIWSTVGLVKIRQDSSAGDDVVALYRQLIAREMKLGDTRITAYTMAGFAWMLRERGDLQGSSDICAKAAKQASSLKFILHMVASRCLVTQLAGGDVADSERELKTHIEALQGAPGSLGGSAVTDVFPLAKIYIAQRQWPAARDVLNLWLDAKENRGNPMATNTMARANALVARCYAALGDTANRDRTAARARVLRRRITEHRSGFEVDLALAQLQGQMGQRDAAVSKLRALAADADKRHWVASALEARLAAYKLLEQAGDPAAAALHDQVEKTGNAHGFKWVLARLDRPASAAGMIARNSASTATAVRGAPAAPTSARPPGG